MRRLRILRNWREWNTETVACVLVVIVALSFATIGLLWGVPDPSPG